MTTTVIIITYNGINWIEKCFEKLKSNVTGISIIVVDNASTDGTPEFIHSKYPEIYLFQLPVNLGFGKANNIGLNRALDINADYVFLLNQDAWIEPDAIEKLIKIHQKHSEYGLLSPVHLDGNGNNFDSKFYQYCFSPVKKLILDAVENNLDEIYPAEFVNAACWLIPRETIEIIGGFDPLFPHYGEDEDYCNRIKNKGRLIGICPKLKVFHDRENRNNTLKGKKLINKIYVSFLIELKNKNNKPISKISYLYKILKQIPFLILSDERLYYWAKIKAYIKLFKVYSIVQEHRNLEAQRNRNYLI